MDCRLNGFSLYLYLALYLVGGCVSVQAKTIPDQRLIAISLFDLQSQVRRSPLNLTIHNRLISQAASSGLQKQAFSEYQKRYEKEPEKFEAALLCGLAADVYSDSITSPTSRNGKSFIASESRLLGQLYETTRNCFEKALKLNPTSGEAHSEYGYFLAFKADNKKKALPELVKGTALSKDNPRAHRLLGEALAMPNTAVYSFSH